MEPPMRLVCGDCLRSIELDVGGLTGLPTVCVYCGGTIDSRLSEIETTTTEFNRPLPPPLGPDEATPWTERWEKGSLGTIGRFQLREVLGDGGFGEVYQAYDPRLDRDVALKVLKQANPGERVMQRFFREARAAARLEHPNIVTVHDAGCDLGRCWIAYQYVSGRTLSRHVEGQRLDSETAVRITRALADALEHAHRLGVFHRDLKPANIIIDEEGRPRLTDFGLARRADLDSDLTRDGAVIGTPAYMSPEQASGRSHLADARSDVYSLGVILYELLCGQRPRDLPSEAPAWRAAQAVPATTLRNFDPTVPRELDRICLKALATNPAHRYPDARDLVKDLDHWLQGRHSMHGVSRPLASIIMGIAAALLLLVGLKAAFAPRDSGRAADPPPVIPTGTVTIVGNPLIALSTKVAPVLPKKLIGNIKSRMYHRINCATLRTMAIANRLEFQDGAQAHEFGYTPCKTCHPPVATPDPAEPSPS